VASAKARFVSSVKNYADVVARPGSVRKAVIEEREVELRQRLRKDVRPASVHF